MEKHIFHKYFLALYKNHFWGGGGGGGGGGDLNDRYSNLFLNAYINRHAHTEYLKMI